LSPLYCVNLHRERAHEQPGVQVTTSAPDGPLNVEQTTVAPTEQTDSPGAEVQPVDASDSGLGRSFVGPIDAAALLIVILVLMAVTVYCLIVVWPPSTNATSLPSSTLFTVKVSPNRDQEFFLVVGLAGALGGLIHSLRSLYWYIGNRVLRRSWLVMYLALPLIGSALAIVFCLVLRGGLLVGEGAGTQINFFGFAAISALVGLFSPEAAEKLKQVFSTLLTPAESGRDRAPATTYAVIHGIEPRIATPGATVTIYGDNLSETTAVLFHGARTQPASVSRAAVTAQIPEGASTGSVRLAVGDRIIAVPGTFHVHSS
jgi:hypothetical protein